MNISDISIKRPSLVIVFFTVLVLLGINSYRSLKYELMPKFTSPIFTVVTVYPGAAPAEVENSVSKKIEDALATLENINTIRSISQESVSMVIIELNLGADLDQIIQEAQRKVDIIRGDLPESTIDPVVTKYSLDDFPVMSLGIKADIEDRELFSILKNRIKPAFSRLEGVGDVGISGGQEREIQVNIYSDKLETFNLSLLQVVQAIRFAGIEFPAGRIKQDTRELTLRLSSKYKSIEDLRSLIIAVLPDGSSIRLSDISEILDTQKDPDDLYHINGSPAMGLSIRKQADANAVEVSRLVREEIDRIENTYRNINLEISIPDDSSVFTMEAAASVVHDLINAIILVSLVMLIFLHSIRNAIIVMISVPVSLIVSFFGMMVFDFTLNMMTLLALSLVIGVLVDDAIVVLENIYRHLEMGKGPVQATADGVREVSLTVVSTTLVLVVVFLPVALADSLIAPILKPYCVIIVFSVLLSMLVAFTIVPLLTSRYSKLESIRKNSLAGFVIKCFESAINRFSRSIHRILLWSLRRKTVTLISATVLFLVSVLLIPSGFIGTEFMNAGDMSKFILQVELRKDSKLEHTNKVIQQAEEYLLNMPEITGVYSSIGSNNEFLAISGGSNKGELTITLVDPDKRELSSSEYANKIKKELNSLIPGAKFSSSVVSIIGGSDTSPIQVVVESGNQDSLVFYADRFKQIISEISGTSDVSISYDSGNPEILIDIDHEKMAQYGLSMQSVGPVLYTAFSGNSDSKYNDGLYDYDINIRLDEFDRKSKTDVQNISFMNMTGQIIRLGQFADITESTGSSTLERYSRIPSIMVEAQVIGRSAGDVGNEVKSKIDALTLPDDVSYSYEGDMKYQAEAFSSLGFAFLASIILVYLIMVALYESYIYPLVVLFSVPLSIIGALFALALAKETLSIISILGLIMLVGLVLKNAILIVDFANQLKRQGYRSLRAIITATNLRLRPILMTSLSLIIGLFPLALAQGTASEWKNGLAWVIIGGLTSSMLLTLVIIPVVYNITDNMLERIKGRAKSE